MKINKITVTNFRSIKYAEITADKFNVFVGQNNHGKTNFFEAIDWFYGAKGDIDKIRFMRDGNAEVCVEIEFSEIQDGIAKMKNEKNKTAIKNLLGENDTARVKRISSDPKTRKIFDTNKNEWLAKNPTGFDSAFNDFLPKFEYVSTQINPMEVAKYGKNTPIANMLSGVLSTILEQNKEYAAFREQFEKLFTAPESEVRVKLDELSGKVKIVSTKVEKVTIKHETPWLMQWTLHTIELPKNKAQKIAETVSKSLDHAHGGSWYADFKNDTHHYIIFRDKIFYIDRKSKKQYDEAEHYGISLGIPKRQLINYEGEYKDTILKIAK